MFHQLGARHHLAAMMGQIGQQPVFLAGQPDGIAVIGDARGAGVDMQRPDLYLGGDDTGGPAQQRAQPRQQFFGIEGLGQIIVGARVEAGHLVAPAVAGGQDQHGKSLAGLAPFLQHGDAVHLGQAQIQDHRIVRFGIAQEIAFLAIQGAVDHIAGIAQRLFQKALQILVILHQKNTHAISP